MGRYIGTSLCKFQDQQNYWLIIHDKLEDRFTTITHWFQDFMCSNIYDQTFWIFHFLCGFGFTYIKLKHKC